MISQILVVTATLGNRDTLQRTINSVRVIGGDDVKHIVIVPEDKIPFIQEQFPYVTCIPEPEKSRSIYAALNFAFSTYAHEYEYMTFINDDDYWLPQFRILINRIKKNRLDFVYGKTIYVDAHDMVLGEQTSSRCFSDFIPLLYSNIILLTQQATIIRSEWYFKLNGFDESYKLVADTKFWAKLSLENIKYQYVNCCCAAYCIQEGQLSSDHETQNVERQRILNEFPILPSHKTIISRIRFRIANMDVYIKRFCIGKNVLNPFLGEVKS